MKRTRVWGLLTLISVGGAAWSQAPQTSGETEKAVAALENQWLQSEKTNNPDLAVSLLADNFVNTWTDGKVTNKSETQAVAKEIKWTSAEYKNLQITVFGDTAIATGGFKGKGTFKDKDTAPTGVPIDVHSRFTDTWLKMLHGKWQCVASHGSIVKM